MSTRERIRIIRLLDKIGRDPAYATALGITAVVPQEAKKTRCDLSRSVPQ